MSNSGTIKPEVLCDLIETANGTTADANRRNQATRELNKAKFAIGFGSGLLQIWQSDKHDDLRLQSLALFKNNCNTIWSRKDGPLSPNQQQEKEHCKQLLLNDYLKEKNEKVVKFVAQCIAKLARHEWPRQWNQLFEILAGNLKSDNGRQVYYTMIILNDLCQEFASMRLTQAQNDFARMAQLFIPMLFELYKKSFESMVTSFKNLFNNSNNCDINEILSLTSLTTLCVASMRILLERVVTCEFDKSSAAGQYIMSMEQALPVLRDTIHPKLASHAKALQAPLSTIIDCIVEMIETFMETIKVCHQEYSLQFRHVLGPILSFYFHIIKTYRERLSSHKDNFLKVVVVKVLLLYREVLRNRTFRGQPVSGMKLVPGQKVVFDADAAKEARLIVEGFFTQQRVESLMNILVSEMMLIDDRLLSLRQEDPCLVFEESKKEWSNDNIRGAASLLFRELMRKFDAVAPQRMTSMFVDVMKNGNVSVASGKVVTPQDEGFDKMLLKEAVYLAFGEGYFEISKELNKRNIDFSKDIGSLILNDIKFVECPFMVERVTWLVGKLKDEMNRSKDLRITGYQLLLDRLSPPAGDANLLKQNGVWNEFMIVRLNAAHSLNFLIDDTNFDSDDFLPYYGRTCYELLRLVTDCLEFVNDSEQTLSSMSSVMTILHTVLQKCSGVLFDTSSSCKKENRFVSKIGDVNGLINQILTHLSNLWTKCSDTQSNLFRQSILTCLHEISKKVSAATIDQFSQQFYEVLSVSVDTSHDENTILNEYGFQLWHSLLHQSVQMRPELEVLFEKYWKNALSGSNFNTDTVSVLLKIVVSYWLLGGEDFVKKHGATVRETLVEVVTNMEDLEIGMAYKPSGVEDDCDVDSTRFKDAKHNESQDVWRQISNTFQTFIIMFPNISARFLFDAMENLVQQYINLVALLDAQPQLNARPKLVRLTPGSLDMEAITGMIGNNGNNNSMQQKEIIVDINEFEPKFGKQRVECFLLVFSRLMVADVNNFEQMINELEKRHGSGIGRKFIESMMESVQYAAPLFYMKITGFAFCLIIKMFLTKFLSFENGNDFDVLFKVLCKVIPFCLKNLEANEIHLLDDVYDARDEINDLKQRQAIIAAENGELETEHDRNYRVNLKDPIYGEYLFEHVSNVLNECCRKLNNIDVNNLMLKIGVEDCKIKRMDVNKHGQDLAQEWQRMVDIYNRFVAQKKQEAEQAQQVQQGQNGPQAQHPQQTQQGFGR